MKLSECKHGEIIVDGVGRIGMIVGITNNCPCADVSTRGEEGRAIPLVQWSDGGPSGIHPGNIKIYKD